MSSVSSSDASDRQSERYDSYTFSADVSEAETSSSFFCRQGDEEAVFNNSVSSSPLPYGFIDVRFSQSRPPIVLPMINPKVAEFQEKPEKQNMNSSEITMMKERFAKLLLGEDMSGSGKGVCTALAISNAITNLSASVFGELWRLEPLAEQKKSMWRREMEWLLCVSDSIVELVPSLQKGGTYEVMTTRPRSDLYINLPALKKLDAMLLNILDGFEETEFWYVDRGIAMDESSTSRASLDKWWLPSPQVSPTGMTKEARGKLQKARDCTNQILKASMAINSCVLAEMDIPDAYLENLPKNAKACLGDEMYSSVADDQFDPQEALNRVDLSSEHGRIEVANRVESAIYVWREETLNLNQRTPKRLSWKTGKTKAGKCMIYAERAEILLHHLRLRFPNLPQTALDMSKIQYNMDVGHAILESYSRVMESLAFNIMARIDDLLFVDDAVNRSSDADSVSVFSRRGFSGGFPMLKPISPSPFSVRQSPYSSSPFSTPAFSGSSPLPGSPKRGILLGRGAVRGLSQKTLDFDKIRSYANSLSAMKVVGDAHERD